MFDYLYYLCWFLVVVGLLLGVLCVFACVVHAVKPGDEG